MVDTNRELIPEIPAANCNGGDAGLLEMMNARKVEGEAGRPKKFNSHVLHRRQLVSQLRLRGLAIQKIAKELPSLQCINPVTSKPWSIGCIFKDLKAIEEEWREFAAWGVERHKARILAELQEVKRSAWLMSKPGIVLDALDREIKVLGCASPVSLDASLSVGKVGDRSNADVLASMTVEELRLLDAAFNRINSTVESDGCTDVTVP